MEMKCMNGGIAGGLSWMESFGRIILLGLFPLTDGLSCDMWRKTAPLKYFFKLVRFVKLLSVAKYKFPLLNFQFEDLASHIKACSVNC